MRLIITLLGLSLLTATSSLSAQTRTNWTNVCRSQDNAYCADVGKDAHNNSSNPPALRGIRLGKIIGVAWRPEGSIISPPGATVRLSPRNAYYYIIDDGFGPSYAFLRQCREIDARGVVQ